MKSDPQIPETIDHHIYQFKKDIKAKIDKIRPKLHKAVDLALQQIEDTILQSSQISEVEYMHRRQTTHDFSQLQHYELQNIAKMRHNSMSVSMLDAMGAVQLDEVLLQEKIKPENIEILIDEDQIFEAVRSAIHVHGAAHQKFRKKRQDCLFEHSGVFDLKTGRYTPFRRPYKLPSSSALLQTNRTLYVCGGESDLSSHDCLPGLLSLNYQGQVYELNPMKRARKSLSIAQAHGIIMATGGWDKCTLNNVEKFFISLNKWGWMPSLNTGRQWPATCVIPESMTAYCFCGFNKKKEVLRTVERVQTQGEREWIQLHLDSRIEPIFCAAACKFQNSLLLFGGHSEQFMFELTLKAELKADHSDLFGIPGDTGVFAYLLQDGNLYTIGQRKDEKYVRYLRVYNGSKWRRLER